MQSLGLGTPNQNQGTQATNMTNELNTAFANNQQATNNSLQFLNQWLGTNPAPAQTWGNIKPPTTVGTGQTIGGGGTNSLGQLVQPPANVNTPPAPNPAAQRSSLPGMRNTNVGGPQQPAQQPPQGGQRTAQSQPSAQAILSALGLA